MTWFEVDKDGLRQLLEGRDKSFVIRELVQNAWDEPGVTEVEITLAPVPGRPAAWVTVIDDAPEGFYDLRHAYTMFANTRKRTDPSKRGRFNMGEKQVLALCSDARIVTTKGSIKFLQNGERKTGREKRNAGSIFTATIPMTREEIAECARAVRTFICPEEITTTFNGERLPRHGLADTVDATLLTEYEDDEGRYRSTRRATTIDIYDPAPGEKAMIYEMGLPIIETGDRWHYNVLQRVPMTAERDNVRPSFLRDVRAEVTNAMIDELPDDDASEPWIHDAAADERTTAETFNAICDKRWGEKRVVADPNDPKSRDRAISEGYAIVSPRALSKEEWGRAREAEAIPSSSALFPTKYGPYETIEEEDWTDEMHCVAELANDVARIGIGKAIAVKMIRAPGGTGGDYGHRTLRFNITKLGKQWFRPENREEILRLIIHEIGHEYGGHLDAAYYNGLALIGARIAVELNLVPANYLAAVKGGSA